MRHFPDQLRGMCLDKLVAPSCESIGVSSNVAAAALDLMMVARCDSG